MIIKKSLMFGIGLLLMSSAYAGTAYKWIDSSGNVQYAQTPPAKQKNVTRSMSYANTAPSHNESNDHITSTRAQALRDAAQSRRDAEQAQQYAVHAARVSAYANDSTDATSAAADAANNAADAAARAANDAMNEANNSRFRQSQ